MVEVHVLHVWTLTSGMNVATAHLVTAPVRPGESATDTATILARAADVMRERFGIEHATLQVEPAGSSACTQTSW